MTQEYTLRVLPEQAANEQTISAYIAREKGLDARTINHVRVLKRSIDARQRTIFVWKCTSPPQRIMVLRIFSMTRGSLSVPICGWASESIDVEAPC